MKTAPKAASHDDYSERINLRCTPIQRAILAEAAHQAGLEVSGYLRNLGMKDAASSGITAHSPEVTARVKAMAAEAPSRPPTSDRTERVKEKSPKAAPPSPKSKAARPKG